MGENLPTCGCFLCRNQDGRHMLDLFHARLRCITWYAHAVEMLHIATNFNFLICTADIKVLFCSKHTYIKVPWLILLEGKKKKIVGFDMSDCRHGNVNACLLRLTLDISLLCV